MFSTDGSKLEPSTPMHIDADGAGQATCEQSQGQGPATSHTTMPFAEVNTGGYSRGVRDHLMQAKEILELGLRNVSMARQAVVRTDGKSIADIGWVKVSFFSAQAPDWIIRRECHTFTVQKKGIWFKWASFHCPISAGTPSGAVQTRNFSEGRRRWKFWAKGSCYWWKWRDRKWRRWDSANWARDQ